MNWLLALLIISALRKFRNRKMLYIEKKGGHMYERYAKIRDEKGLTDYAVSKATGIAPSTISDWKSGRTTPKVDKLAKIARFLDVRIEDFIGG